MHSTGSYVRDQVQGAVEDDDGRWAFSQHVIHQDVPEIQEFLREGQVPDVNDVYWVFGTQNLELFKDMVGNVSCFYNLHCVARSILNIGTRMETREYLEVILKKVGRLESDVFSFISFSNPNYFPEEIVKFSRENGADISHLFSRCCTLNDMRRLRGLGASVFSKVHSIRFVNDSVYGIYSPCGSVIRDAISLDTFVNKMDSYTDTNGLPMFGRLEDYKTIVKEEYGFIKIQKCFRRYLARKHSKEDNFFKEVSEMVGRIILEFQAAWKR